MATTADFRPGMVIKFDGELYELIEFQHVNPGNWRAFVRAKLKGIKSGKTFENRFRAGEAIEQVRVERKQMQYLYHDGAGYVCMDQETYDQISVPEEAIGEQSQFLKENTEVEVLFDGSNILGFELPVTVDLIVTNTVPGVKGDTATGGTKPATMDTGATVNVPLFINEGDKIRIDTRTGIYIERVK
ncbi:MAG: elongation factor P [Ignavibacteria bacterium]|nr:elongation factor P [Ignavibacteria bacterium]